MGFTPMFAKHLAGDSRIPHLKSLELLPLILRTLRSSRDLLPPGPHEMSAERSVTLSKLVHSKSRFERAGPRALNISLGRNRAR